MRDQVIMEASRVGHHKVRGADFPLPGSSARSGAAADLPSLNRPWRLALDAGLLQAVDGTATAGPALETWPPDDTDILTAWLDGLLAAAGSESGSPFDDKPATDILLLLTAVQQAADDAPLREQLIEQRAELAKRFRLEASFYWPEKRIANTMDRLASFGAIGGGEVTSLGRWASTRLADKLAEPDTECTAAELIVQLADGDADERDEEAWAWLNARPDPVEAARQLLTAGASMEPLLRCVAVTAVELLQEEALPVWREMAAVPGMEPHAKFALATTGEHPEPDGDDWLWLAVEWVAMALADQGPDEAITVLSEALTADNLAVAGLEGRLAMVRTAHHPSAPALAAALENFVASAGAERLSVNQCLRLKVSLVGWKPPIWRTVLIPATADLAGLHFVIQVLYGWDGDHLHVFRVGRASYSDPSFSLEQTRDERAMRVLTALNAGGGKLTYEYDLGAGWVHTIVLQGKVPREPGISYPFCARYSGESPIEYPDYEDDDEQQFEPFDLEEVNRRLAALGNSPLSSDRPC